MTNKHTPWHIGVKQPSSDKFIYGSKGEEIADCDRLTNFPAENLANARLIAAAPELLEACKQLNKAILIRGMATEIPEMYLLQESINKAEGNL